MMSSGGVQAKPEAASLRRSSRNVTVKNEDTEAEEETQNTVEEEQTLKENSDSEERERLQDTEKKGECDGGEEVPLKPPTAVGVEEPAKRGRGKASIKRKKEPSISSTIPQGKPKSGRIWKENKKRFSSMVKDRPLRTSWEVKMKERQEKKMMKSLAQQLKEEKQREKEEKRKRREENIRRRLENERKAEVVQVIRNPAKLKRARKKQLRSIEKRDTLAMSQAGKRQGATTPSSQKHKAASS